MRHAECNVNAKLRQSETHKGTVMESKIENVIILMEMYFLET